MTSKTKPPAAAKTALITGASSGIGEALAKRFASAGYNIVLVARSADKLKALAASLTAEHGVKTHVAAADLSLPGAARKLALSMQRARRPIGVLVNCAGVLQHGPFADMAAARHQQMIDLNVSGLTAMLARFFPMMVARGQGKVRNVASIAAFQPVPSLASYAATKACVLSLAESLSEECNGTGVTLTALCPGITATGMLQGAKAGSTQLNKLPDFSVGSAEDVAHQGFKACLRGDVICVPGTLNRVSVVAGRATPKWLLRRVSGALVRAVG